MRYWVYSQGLIQGPYHESALAGVAGFGPDTLVCPEDKAGSQPSDWRRAGSVPALSMLVSSVPAGTSAGGPEPWLAPSESTDPDILSQLDEYWTEFRRRPEAEGEPSVGRLESRVFELEQRLQSFDLDQKALLKKLAEKEHLLAELLSRLEPLERRLLGAEAAKEQALREMRHEMERIKDELRRKEDELRLLRSSPELAGPWAAPPIAGGPMDLESYLAALERSLGTGELPTPPGAPSFSFPVPPELVVPPVPGFGEAGLAPTETLPPVSMPEVPRPEPIEGPPPVVETPKPAAPPEPVVQAPAAPAPVVRPEPSLPRTELPPPAPVVEAPAPAVAPEELSISEGRLAPAAKKLQGEVLPAALLASSAPIAEAPAPAAPAPTAPVPAKAQETAPPPRTQGAVTGPVSQRPMEAVHLPPAPPPTAPQVTMPHLTASAPVVSVPNLAPPPPIPAAPGSTGRITGPITPITPAPGAGGIAAKPELTEVLAKLGKKPDLPAVGAPPPAPSVPVGTAAARPAAPAPAQAPASVPGWMTKIPPLANFWTKITRKKAAASAPTKGPAVPPPAPPPKTAAAAPAAISAPVPVPPAAGTVPVPAPPAPSVQPSPKAGATVAAPAAAPAKKGGQRTFLLVFGLGVVALGMVVAIFLFREQRELGRSSAEQVKGPAPMETGLPAKGAAPAKEENLLAQQAPAPAPAPTAPSGAAPASSPFPEAAAPAAGAAQVSSPAPEAPAPQAPKPAFQLPPGADALQLAKNYSLGPGRGSLGLYLTKQFLASGSDDLMEDWSSSEMQSGVYLVEYKVLHLLPDGRAQRLSNYIFQVDVRKKTVEGYNSGARMILGAPQASAGGASTP